MRKRLIVPAVVLVLTAAGCGGTTTPTVAGELGGEYVSDMLDMSYEGALGVANQLALGTMLLEETDDQVTPDQAASLLPLWQALQGGVTSEAEAEAVLRQIESTMTAEQAEAIAAMQLTQEDMQAWMADQGYAFSGPGGTLSPEIQATLEAGGGEFPSPGEGEPRLHFGEDGEMPPQMATRMAQTQNMTEEEREAMRATAEAGGGFMVAPGGAGGPGGFGGRSGDRTVGLLVQPLIEMLEGRAAEG